MATIKFNPNPAPAFIPPTASKSWLASLNQQPVISPSFAGTLAIVADEALLEWMRANAPTDILDLLRCASSLHGYEQEFLDGEGMVREDSNSSILDTVARCINALDRVGDAWISTTP